MLYSICYAIYAISYIALKRCSMKVAQRCHNCCPPFWGTGRSQQHIPCTWSQYCCPATSLLIYVCVHKPAHLFAAIRLLWLWTHKYRQPSTLMENNQDAVPVTDTGFYCGTIWRLQRTCLFSTESCLSSQKVVPKGKYSSSQDKLFFPDNILLETKWLKFLHPFFHIIPFFFIPMENLLRHLILIH